MTVSVNASSRKDIKIISMVPKYFLPMQGVFYTWSKFQEKHWKFWVSL
jgi:hypothetical protein